MGDEADRDACEDGPAPAAAPAVRDLAADRRTTRIATAAGAATACLCSIVAVNTVVIVSALLGTEPTAAAPRDAAATALHLAMPVVPFIETRVGEAPSTEARADGAPEVPTPGEMDDAEEAEPQPRREPPKRSGTVFQAAASSCSTSTVDGLSRQIVAQARCIDPNAFRAVPPRKNLVTRPNVFLYLETSARDGLLRVLDAHPERTMKVNSALRTVAQQYLLWRWSAGKRCGIQLATPPGDSNHETGLALDISEPSKWRAALEAEDFRWLGTIDRVHFDYKGGLSTPHASVDVMAFQQLWNKNHPDDTISVTGRYGGETDERLKRSPARGFAIGASCDKARTGVPARATR